MATNFSPEPVVDIDCILAELDEPPAVDDELKTLHISAGYVAVVAIDIGTAFSGYAFSTRTNTSEVRVNTNWGADLGFPSYKTPTCVLFDSKKKFKSFY